MARTGYFDEPAIGRRPCDVGAVAPRLLDGRLVVAAAVLAAWLQAAAAEPVVVPGTTVALEPPPGFVSATSFAGFEHAASGSSIMVTELPREAYDRIAAAFATRDEAADDERDDVGHQVPSNQPPQRLQVAERGRPDPEAVRVRRLPVAQHTALAPA